METAVENLEELIKLVNLQKEFKINVKVIANSKVNSIEFLKEYIKIKTTQRAIEGRANKSIIEYLSKITSVSKSKIQIVSGEKSNLKIIKFF